VLAAATYVLAQFLFSQARTWLPFISTETALALALPTGFGYRFVREHLLKSAAEAERRQLMDIFSKYVSPEVAAEIWDRRSEIVLAGQEKLVTVMFTDIRSFTKRTATKPSMEVLHWLNDYFSAMTEVTKQYGGFVNKFIGDGIMIVFGLPLSHGTGQDAFNAVQAGVAMLERLKRFNGEHAGDTRYPRTCTSVSAFTRASSSRAMWARAIEWSIPRSARRSTWLRGSSPPRRSSAPSWS
jgi:hypothetical protein